MSLDLGETKEAGCNTESGGGTGAFNEKRTKPHLVFANKPQPCLEQEKTFKRCLKKGGAKEWGAFSRQPTWRQKQLIKGAKRAGLTLEQAWSQRRGLMKNKNRFRNKIIKANKHLGLPHESIVQEKAALFEKEIEFFLITHKVLFVTEASLRAMNRESGLTTTPDFFFEEPLLVRVDGRERWVHWLEAKCFYGAADKERFNQKKILQTAKRYEAERGYGLMVFAFGFAQEVGFRTEPFALCVDWSSTARHSKSV